MERVRRGAAAGAAAGDGAGRDPRGHARRHVAAPPRAARAAAARAARQEGLSPSHLHPLRGGQRPRCAFFHSLAYSTLDGFNINNWCCSMRHLPFAVLESLFHLFLYSKNTFMPRGRRD